MTPSLTGQGDPEGFRDARVLVAGGSGFLGRALAQRLAALGADVLVLGLDPAKPRPETPGVARAVADLRDRAALARVLSGERFDFAINLGGYINHAAFAAGGRDVIDVHYLGLTNLIEALGQSPLRGFVQVGSSDEYGNVPAPQREDMREAPFSPYSAAKAGASHFVQALARTEGFPGSVVRFFLVYGPGQDQRRFLPQIIRGALADAAFPTSLGGQLRDFLYIDDAVAGTLAALAPEARGEVFNIASGVPVSIREMIETVVRSIGKGRPDFGAVPYRPGENMALYADVEKARRLLGFAATIPLDEGLGRTIAWYAACPEERR